jgi:DNA polymerase-3 subunit beta
VEEEGIVVVPARPFQDLIKKLDEGTIVITSDKDGTELTINAEKKRFKLRTLPPGDFPQGMPVPEGKKLVISGEVLLDAIKKTIRAASKDETRLNLTGIHMETSKNSLTLAATDSYRLAVSVIPCVSCDEGIEVLVPSRALDEVSKILEDMEVEIVVTENRFFVSQGNWVFSTRLIESQFPAYKQLFPDSCDVELTVNKKDIIDAVDRISTVLKVNTVTLNVGTELVTVSGSSTDFGDAEEEVPAKATGEISVTFNQQYLLDGLKGINAETIRIEIQEGLNPSVIRPLDGEDFSYLLMPVKS